MNRALSLVLPAVAALLLAGCSPSKDSCRSPSFMCNGKCIDGSRDPSNCGGCGVTCGAGQTCCGACVDLQTSEANCGACGARCPIDGVCSAGVCSCPGARPDQCGTNPGSCVNLQTGLGGFCGTCGVVCQGPGVAGGDATCTTGACVCSGAATDCSSTSPAIVCVNTLVDPANCGGCGLHCAPHATCASNGAPPPTGVCGCADPAFPDSCGAGPGGAGCVNFATDPANCGGCAASGASHVCTGATPSCSSGKCCPAGFTNCSGTCVDTRTTDLDCGACGHVCAPTESCVASTCTCMPATPIVCGGSCCAGTGCCSGGAACQTQHTNGLGQFFFDCNPLYSASNRWTDVAARAAADAWASGTTFLGLCDGSCLGRQTATSCAVWCFGLSAHAGRVTSGATINCPGLCLNFAGVTPTWQ